MIQGYFGKESDLSRKDFRSYMEIFAEDNVKLWRGQDNKISLYSCSLIYDFTKISKMKELKQKSDLDHEWKIACGRINKECGP